MSLESLCHYLFAKEGNTDVKNIISSGALEFWTTYTEFAIDLSFDEDHEERVVAWMEVARQRIEAVVEASWEKIQVPPPNVAISWVRHLSEWFPWNCKEIFGGMPFFVIIFQLIIIPTGSSFFGSILLC